MKQILLTGLFSVATLAVSAALPQVGDNAVSAKRHIVENHVKAPAAKPAKRPMKSTWSVRTNGATRRIGSNRIAPAANAAASEAANEAVALFESFEGWDGTTADWTPDGWTVEMKGEVERADSWTPATPEGSFMSPSDGNYFYAINLSSKKQDEWLISPAVDIAEDYVLAFDAFIDPAYLFNTDMDHINWDEMEFVGEKVVAATLQVWAQPDGEEWTMIHDFADDYKSYTLMELLYMSPAELEKKSVSLAALTGKKARIALRYVGSDGNTMYIDKITVGYPVLEGIRYLNPTQTLYWGFERGFDLQTAPLTIAQYPVYAPLTWSNYSDVTEADFTWRYTDPESKDWSEINHPYELTLTYAPDYSTERSKVNNLYFPPTLSASAAHAQPASYTAPFNALQAGGKFETTFSDGSKIEGGLLPFNFVDRGLSLATIDFEAVGDLAMPVFGHDAYTNRYWLEYTLNGHEPEEGDDVQLDGILNYIFPSEAPLVVSGVDVFGAGEIQPDAELKIAIYALPPTFEFFGDETPMASAVIKGSDVLSDGTGTGYLCMPFDFDEPAVIVSSEDTPAYIVMLSGFNSDKVTYFAPLQSAYPDDYCLGYTMKRIRLNGEESYRTTMAPIEEHIGEFGECRNAFAIALRGEYPWLTTDSKGIELPADGTAATVSLGSYYDGSKLAIDAPEGITATAAGRYDECVLTVTHSDPAKEVDGKIAVKAPGLAIEIPVKAAAAGIADIEDGNGVEITGIYDLGGRRVNPAGAKAGVYVIKYSDGTVVKTAVK